MNSLGNKQKSCTKCLLPYLLIFVFEEQEGRPCSSGILLRSSLPGIANGLNILVADLCQSESHPAPMTALFLQSEGKVEAE